MPTSKGAYIEAATRLVEARVKALSDLSFSQAAALPETDSAKFVIEGMASSITTFRYSDAYAIEGRVLVVVLAARPTLLGIAAQHIERGLVFSPYEAVRPATQLELQNSGG